MSTDRRRTYEAYLLTEHWATLRDKAINAANRKCEACRGIKRLEGHHLVYRTPLESCVVEDIMCLCNRCHGGWHKWLESNGKYTTDFDRQQTASQLRTMIGQGHVKRQRRNKKGHKQPPPTPPKRYDFPSKQSVLETVVFEQGKIILEMGVRLTALEAKLAAA